MVSMQGNGISPQQEFLQSGPDGLGGFRQLLTRSFVLPPHMSTRFRELNLRWRWIKSISVLLILALGTIGLHPRPPLTQDAAITVFGIALPLVWLTPVTAVSVAGLFYMVKRLISESQEDQDGISIGEYYSRRTQLFIAGLEWLGFTTLLAFIGLVFGELRLELTLLLVWVLYRVGENGSFKDWGVFLVLSLLSVLLASVLTFGVSAATVIPLLQTWVLHSVWISTLSTLGFMLRRHVAWRELAAKYQGRLEPVRRELLGHLGRSQLRAIAARAASEMHADIVVLYPWDTETNAPIRPPVVVCRPGVDLRNRQYVETNEVVIQQNNPVWMVIDYFQQHKTPYFCQDVRNDALLFRDGKNDHGHPNFIVRESIASSIGIPLTLDDGMVVGVMWANYLKPTRWNDERRRQYTLLCEVLSSVITAATARAAALRAELMTVLHEQVKGSLGLALGQLATAADISEPVSARETSLRLS